MAYGYNGNSAGMGGRQRLAQAMMRQQMPNASIGSDGGQYGAPQGGMMAPGMPGGYQGAMTGGMPAAPGLPSVPGNKRRPGRY